MSQYTSPSFSFFDLRKFALDALNTRKKPNVRDVARRAGVSVATVSRVLNDGPNVSTKTRERVELAIEDLGFVRSSAARAINSGRTHLVGALIPTLDNAIFARFIDALEAVLDQRGLSLVVATTNDTRDREVNRAAKLLGIGAEALIVSGITRGLDFDRIVRRHKVPVIATSYFADTSIYPTIGYDNSLVAQTALKHLISLQHQHIAVLSGPSATNDRTRARQEGLRRLDKGHLTFFEGELTYAAASDMVSLARQQVPNVTAFLCLSDVLAQGALLRLRAEGVAVPDAVSVIGVDDLPASASFDPPLTTVHLPVDDMGHKTARAVADWIESGARPDHQLLPTRLMVRATTGPVA